MAASNFKIEAARKLAASATDIDFDDVYRSEAPRLFRFFRGRTNESHDPQSLTQETMLRFLRGAPNSKIASPQAYLRRIAANLLRDRYRSDRRHAADQHVQFEDDDVAGPSLERQLEARDLLRLVDAAILELRPRTREVFLAVRMDGMSYAEVRGRTGLSMKIIEKEMARALARINRITAED